MSQFRDITVLMSATNSNSMPGVYKSFKNNGERNIKVVGVDMSSDPSAKYLVDSFYQVPAVSAPDSIDIILNICKEEKVDIYILSVSNLDSVAISNNKLETYQTLEKAGIPVPRYYGVHTFEDFVEGMKYMGYPEKPVCIKIVDGSGSRGVRIIDSTKSRYDIFVKEKPNSFYISYEDMLSMLQSAPAPLHEMMLVECMHGPEFTVDLLADKGETLYIGGRENVVSLMSIAQESVIKYDELAYQISKDVVKLLKMDGNVGFDFMRNDKEEAVLMDINPRTTATISLFTAGGLNFRYLRIKQLLGEELPKECEPKMGTRVKRRYLETFTDAEGKLVNI